VPIHLASSSKLLAQGRRFPDYGFDWPNAFGVTVLEDRNDCGQRRIYRGTAPARASRLQRARLNFSGTE